MTTQVAVDDGAGDGEVEPSPADATVRHATHVLLRTLGMTTIFGNPGSTELRLFRDSPADLRYVLGLQESSVVAMADGFAQATRRAAFVNLHSAVGVGHALGSIFTAMRNQAPLVITAGQQVRAMLPLDPFLFSEEAPQLPKPYVKWSCEPARAQDVPAALARAYHMAMQRPQGPTFVSIPDDDWDAPGEPVPPHQVSDELMGDPAALEAVAGALGRSRRPAVVVGPGVDRDGAWSLAVDLVERTGASAWISPLSSRGGFPEDHPSFAGFLVPERRRLADQLVAHDVVVVLGAPVFTYHVHAEGPVLAEGTELFQLVDDPAAAARAPIGTVVLTTLRLALVHVLAALGPHDRGPGRGRVPAPPPPATEPMAPGFVMATIAQVRPAGAIVVEEAPSHRNALHDHLPTLSSGGFYAGGSGGLGWALPAAVGVAMGQPGRRVICLLGDGSSLYSIQALWNAVQDRLPISFVIFNNGGYSALKSLGRRLEIERPPGVDLPGLDFVALAAGFGCPGQRVERAGELEVALRASFSAAGPSLIDVVVDPTIERLYSLLSPAARRSSSAGNDGARFSTKLWTPSLKSAVRRLVAISGLAAPWP